MNWVAALLLFTMALGIARYGDRMLVDVLSFFIMSIVGNLISRFFLGRFFMAKFLKFLSSIFIASLFVAFFSFYSLRGMFIVAFELVRNTGSPAGIGMIAGILHRVLDRSIQPKIESPKA